MGGDLNGGEEIAGPPGDAVFPLLRVEPDRRWCLIQTRPRNEKWTNSHLAAAGVRVYLPLLTRVETHHRNRRETKLPMFPGYLFGCADTEEEALIRENRCVWNLRRLSEPEEEQLLSDLRTVRICELESAAHRMTVNPGLRSGDRVRITAGAFKGLSAVVVRRVDALSVIINLDFLGRSIDIRWDAGELILDD